MKKIITILAIVFISYNMLFAQTFEVEGIVYKIKSTNTVEVSTKIPEYTGNIVIPEKVNYNEKDYTIVSIGSLSFWYCTDLTSVIIPNSVKSIGYAAFWDCTGLTSVVIGNSVTTIEGMAFSGCSGITSITLPNSVTSIGEKAFCGCIGLTSIVIPNSVIMIENMAFIGCTGLTSITISNSITAIRLGTFSGCSNLIFIIVPNSVTSIGERAFSGCYNLSYITIPNSVKSIGKYAFSDCIGLTSLIIPNSVTSIGERAFENCTGFSDIICYTITPPTLENNVFVNVSKSIPLYVPSKSVDAYKAANQWKEFNVLPIVLDRTICQGDTAILSVFNYLDSYLWSTGDITPEIKVFPTQTSTYTLTGTIGGSTTIDTIIVTIDFVIPTANAGADQTIDIIGSATLVAIGGSIYSWSNGAKTDTITLKPIRTSTYTVTVSNSACTATDDVVVTVLLPKIEVTPMRVELFNDNKKSNSIAYHTSSKDYDAKDYDLAVSVIIDTMPLYESRQNRLNLKYASSIDWSSYDTEAKNQGNCGSCWSFTGIALIENISKQVAGQQGIPQTNINLSEQTILSCNSVVSYGCNGGWPIWVYNYTRKYGVPNETCLPYKAKDATTIPCNNKCSEPEYNIKVTDVHDYMWGFNMTVSDLREALQEGPISVAMYVPQSFFYYNGGIYKYKGGYSEFGHAVLLVGYDDDLKCFKAKNSWGTSWGENGYFRISYDDVSSAVKFGCFAQRATNPYASNLKPSNTLITIKNIGSGTLNINSIKADKSWLTVGSVSKTSLKTDSSVSFTCTIEWNIIADKDSSLISISTNDPETPTLKAKIIAYKSQTGNVPGSICVTPPFYQDNILPADTGHFDINILNIGETNISYSITADVDWINITQANATNDATIKVNLSANNTMQERTGLINIVDNNTSSSRSLMVKQGVNVAPKAMDIYKTGEDIVRFAKKDFVDAYTGNSPIQFVRIDELPESGNLLLGNRNVVAFQTISIDSIDNLLYMPEDKDGRFVFRYRASDGSNRSIEQASGIMDIISSIRENIDRDSRFIITIKDDELIIRILDANVKPHAVYVYSIDGRMLMRLDIKNKDNVYNIASLKPGVYLLKITDINDNMLKVQKIVR